MLGPARMPAGWPGSTSSTTWLMRRFVPCSRPFTSDTTGTHGRSSLASSSRTPRKPCDGTPMTTTSAQFAASLKSVVARRRVGQLDLVAEVLLVAVPVVDVGGGPPPNAPTAASVRVARRWMPRWYPGAAAEDDDPGCALIGCHAIRVWPGRSREAPFPAERRLPQRSGARTVAQPDSRRRLAVG